MKTEFNEDKRMQLLEGSKVVCIKSVEAHAWPDGYFYDTINHTRFKSEFPVYEFTSGKEYPVQYTNVLKGDLSGGHTWSIAAFRSHFKELSNAKIN